jgi:type IV fimbrial biogenesis protein FimT
MKWINSQVEHAFTLIELIITLLIVAVIAAIAIPYTGHYLEQRRVEGAAQAVYAKLNVAHAYALANQVQSRVVFQAGANWCVGVTTAASCDCSSSSSCNLGQEEGTTYKNVSLSLGGFGGATDVVFSASRGTVPVAGAVTLTVSSGTITVETTQMGISRICSNSGLGGFPSC